jgi:hypothetical protein
VRPRLPVEQIAEQQLRHKDGVIGKAVATLEAAANRFAKHGHVQDALETHQAAQALLAELGEQG